jgi:transcriptional regulator with XRE-family HTH domain
MALAGTGSALVRRQLGIRLRRLREQAGKTLEDVEIAGIAGPTKMWRIEKGKVAVKVGDIWALCNLYAAPPDVTEVLVALAQGARVGAYSEEYDNLVVPDWLGLYAGLEATARSIQTYHPELVHGLLQTPEYARAVISADERLDFSVVEKRVAFRLGRQRAVLEQQPLPRVAVILGAGVLALRVGSDQIMQAQQEHLLNIARQGIVSIRVVPWEAGAYPMRGAFTLLEFDDPEDPAVAYVEIPLGARYLEQEAQVQECRYVLSVLHAKSVPIGEYLS